MSAIVIIDNCYCVGCNKYYKGPAGKWPDEITLLRCDACEKQFSENGLRLIKMTKYRKQDGSIALRQSILY